MIFENTSTTYHGRLARVVRASRPHYGWSDLIFKDHYLLLRVNNLMSGHI